MPEATYADVPAFLAALRTRGVEQAIIAWRDEFGPIPGPDGSTHYRPCKEAVLLAYDHGTLLRCVLPEAEADRRALHERLRAAGIAVQERCRNLMRPATSG